MPATANAKSKKPSASSRLYRSAKITDYRFRKVLDQFVRDRTALEAATATGLSVNSVHAIYRKLRVFFYEVGLFLDPYRGKDPMNVELGDPQAELELLSFHLRRYGEKRGLKSPSTEPSYHFAESCWRYDYAKMMSERPPDAVYAMMQSHLLELIRLCGPVGAKPRNRQAGLQAVARQIDHRIEWFRKNAPGFRSEQLRTDLGEAKAIISDPN